MTVQLDASPRALATEVRHAIQSIDDPEYPGISIVDLGLLETVHIDGNSVHVGLIPTFSGCPALAMIADDVATAVRQVAGVDEVTVEWLRGPAWTIDRTTATARRALGQQFTVAVRIGTREPACPRCGSATTPHSLFGPSRCRSVSVCSGCNETIEVMRS